MLRPYSVGAAAALRRDGRAASGQAKKDASHPSTAPPGLSDAPRRGQLLRLRPPAPPRGRAARLRDQQGAACIDEIVQPHSSIRGPIRGRLGWAYPSRERMLAFCALVSWCLGVLVLKSLLSPTGWRASKRGQHYE